MVSINSQIPELVDFLQPSVVQEESWSEWVFLSRIFFSFAFLNIELHTVQRTPSFQVLKVLFEILQGPHQNLWFLSFYNTSTYSAMVLQGSTTLRRSLINIMKNRASNKEPWGARGNLPIRMKMHHQSINHQFTLFASDLLD